jgi:hypothetical protein
VTRPLAAGLVLGCISGAWGCGAGEGPELALGARRGVLFGGGDDSPSVDFWERPVLDFLPVHVPVPERTHEVRGRPRAAQPDSLGGLLGIPTDGSPPPRAARGRSTLEAVVAGPSRALLLEESIPMNAVGHAHGHGYGQT